jgi:hypothetical protein
MWLSELKSGVSVEQFRERRKRNGCLTGQDECVKNGPVLRVNFHPEAIVLAFAAMRFAKHSDRKTRREEISVSPSTLCRQLPEKGRMFLRRLGPFMSSPMMAGVSST